LNKLSLRHAFSRFVLQQCRYHRRHQVIPCSRPLRSLWMLRLPSLQVRLSCLLWGAKGAEVPSASSPSFSSLVPALV
jgi:hypothetical protein